MAKDQFKFKILKDGSGKLETDQFSDGSHFVAEEFLKTLATRLGGEVTVEAREHTHEEHVHEHFFEEEHEHN